MMMNRRVLVIALLLAIVATACRATPEITTLSAPNMTEQVNGRELPPTPEPVSVDNPFADPVLGGGIDLRLTRDDIDCTERTLDIYDDTPFVVAHVVVDGNLGAPCFGEPDERLVRAWNALATITPAGQLHDLAVFSGFVSNENDQTTLAFVNIVGDAREASDYHMAVNLIEAERDPDELLMTMAHEFAHVLTTQPDQIERSVYPKDCATWHNLRGCYAPDSLMWAWIQEFWDEGRIDVVNPKREPSRAAGEDLCIFDPSFLGPYAASHPEEDFAEAFSAFVFQVDLRSRELEEKMEWFALQPELAEFRNRAIEAGLGPLNRVFAECG